MTPEELRADLTRPWRHGEHADLRGIVLDGALNLEGAIVRGFDLGGSRLMALSARGAHLKGLAWLSGATIDGIADLRGATARSDLRADALRCPVLDLRGARIEGVLRLERAQIGELRLDGAVMMANLSLGDARIAAITASGAAVLGGIWAEGAAIDDGNLEEMEVEGRRTSTAHAGTDNIIT